MSYTIKTGTDIVPLDSQKSSGNSLTLKLPFTAMVTGGKSQGKSTLLLNMLLSKDLLAGKFNKVIYISPTIEMDQKVKMLGETKDITIENKALKKELKKLRKKSNKKLMDFLDEMSQDEHGFEFLDTPDVNDLMALCDYQKSVIKTFDKSTADKILLVLDDLASMKKLWTNKNFIKIIFNSRHYNISLIVTAQTYKSISKDIRLNNTLLILFETSSADELVVIYNENKVKYTNKQFLEICNFVYATPFNFIVFNTGNDMKHRLQMNFKYYICDIFKPS